MRTKFWGFLVLGLLLLIGGVALLYTQKYGLLWFLGWIILFGGGYLALTSGMELWFPPVEREES